MVLDIGLHVHVYIYITQKSIPMVLSQTKTPEKVNIRQSNKVWETITLDRFFLSCLGSFDIN